MNTLIGALQEGIPLWETNCPGHRLQQKHPWESGTPSENGKMSGTSIDEAAEKWGNTSAKKKMSNSP